MHAPPVMWLPYRLFDMCVAEANIHEPLESGGVFMGYWADASSVVVTGLVGAGPHCDRGLRHFAPDFKWQALEIGSQYEASGRKHVYLGDWHSHPAAEDGKLSRKDRRVLRRIIETPAARARRPVMAIIHGAKVPDRMTVWVAEMRQRPLLWPCLTVTEGMLQVF